MANYNESNMILGSDYTDAESDEKMDVDVESNEPTLFQNEGQLFSSDAISPGVNPVHFSTIQHQPQSASGMEPRSTSPGSSTSTSDKDTESNASNDDSRGEKTSCKENRKIICKSLRRVEQLKSQIEKDEAQMRIIKNHCSHCRAYYWNIKQKHEYYKKQHKSKIMKNKKF